MKKYRHVLFDLDRTLWDFEINNKATLNEVFDRFHLKKKCNCSFETFFEIYNIVNNSLWENYRCGKLTKEILLTKRFVVVLEHFNVVDASDAISISDYYLAESPRKKQLLPYAKELLEYLVAQNYSMHIVTNGFKDIQHTKLNISEIRQYFENVFTSEVIGFPKPDKRFFEFVLRSLMCSHEDCIMIGDDFKNDILGACSMHIDAIFVNFESHKVESTNHCLKEVFSLKEIEKIL